MPYIGHTYTLKIIGCLVETQIQLSHLFVCFFRQL